MWFVTIRERVNPQAFFLFYYITHHYRKWGREKLDSYPLV